MEYGFTAPNEAVGKVRFRTLERYIQRIISDEYTTYSVRLAVL
jgi:hypothetical protein